MRNENDSVGAGLAYTRKQDAWQDAHKRRNYQTLEKRLDLVKRLHDDYERLIAARDGTGLRRLAAEWDALGLPRMAKVIRLAAGNLK
jgi:hypothetical protein